MPNRLAHESSPYLLQHANNPVDWQPWDAAAHEQARREGKPIFLSIGYSACHWCHVMEHESFENPRIAALLNERFVSIKVDREERPDLDQIYMNAVQMLTGRGGWPMSVFLTPDLKPFYGGTYFPPQGRWGMPGFDQVLAGVSDAWRNRRAEVDEQADLLTRQIQLVGQTAHSTADASIEWLYRAAEALGRTFDPQHGGFGQAPKFPHPMDLRLLLRLAQRDDDSTALNIVTTTLDRMAAGGIYDHLGGGFHRYSVDERWLVPHFEKMLYDNALLAATYTEAFQLTGHERYAATVRETLDYVLREMTDPAGGFYSTQDADSEGVEGKFYVWSPAELEAVLGPERARTFAAVYDVTAAGNFEGHNILNLTRTIDERALELSRAPDELRSELAQSRLQLRTERERRVHPGLDDKVLVSWNGLMIEALALAGSALAEPRYLEAAARAARFLLDHVRNPDGRLLHAWRQGRAKFAAYLDDYAALAGALVSLYSATWDEAWIDRAAELADQILRRFLDPADGSFYYTADDHETLIARQKDMQDNAVPSGNALAATALARLGFLCGRNDFLDAARQTVVSCGGLLQQAPTACGQMLLAADLLLGPTQEFALIAPSNDELIRSALRSWRRVFRPRQFLTHRARGGAAHSALDAVFADRPDVNAQPTLYICENFTCSAPIVGTSQVAAALIGERPRRQATQSGN